ncbi:bacteriocin immunity protein [Streptococcus pseudoporcinus]|uniref:bacteriocin immunity protein n=1 Tax=Streptococcus pseudoporcinus TaxID=361101 RepID=UPI000984334D|nr:bacteriocin immunity protein [Streptococcus pseudoporcinus]VUC65971.1 bacteriocin immunity protein [Streptococcus pseudoporcinus]VUC96898.1 bacteriocin immunity protein [Streptococcus pseudoporcinus]VUC97286.1 bacteriocin immunity protein [Streptococcus pseudoporcinus]
MSALKWFSGGKNRKKEAVRILDLLIASHAQGYNQSQHFIKVLHQYQDELHSNGTSVLLILSRMNIELASAFKEGKITVTTQESAYLKQLRAVSNIRYDY